MSVIKELGGSLFDFADSTIDRLSAQNRAYSTAEQAKAAAMLANVQITEERERRAQDRKDSNQAMLQNVIYALMGITIVGALIYAGVYVRKNIKT